ASARSQSANPWKCCAGSKRADVVRPIIQVVIVNGVAPEKRVRRRKILVHANLSVILPLPACRWKRELITGQVRRGIQIEKRLYHLGYDSRTAQCRSARRGICQRCVVRAPVHELVAGCRQYVVQDGDAEVLPQTFVNSIKE